MYHHEAVCIYFSIIYAADLPRVGFQERFLVPDSVPSQQPTEDALVPTRTSLSVALGPPGPSPSIPTLVNEKGDCNTLYRLENNYTVSIHCTVEEVRQCN